MAADFDTLPIQSSTIPELAALAAVDLDYTNDLLLIHDPSLPGDKKITAGNLLLNRSRLFNSGLVSAPSISFVGDTDTGIYRKAADFMGIATAGVDRIVLTAAGRVGVGVQSPAAKMHVVNGSNASPNEVTCGLRVTSYWKGTTATPYQNNDNSLWEVFNDVGSNSLNLSWGGSFANAYNNIPVGVADTGNRVGVYGWAVSAVSAGYAHAGTLEFQYGTWGRAGFLGPGSPSTGIVKNAIAVRGDIVNDSTGTTLKTAIAGAFTSTTNIGGVVEKNFGVVSEAAFGTVENWSFHGTAGNLFNQDKSYFGSKFTEAPNVLLCARATGNTFEFGFPTAGGYASAVGAMPSSGKPFISFCARVDAAADTFTTSGKSGHVIYEDLSASSLVFSRITTPTAAAQTPVECFRVDQNNRVQFQQTPIIPAFAPAATSSVGQTGQIGWDANFLYVCIGTNSWRRTALSTW